MRYIICWVWIVFFVYASFVTPDQIGKERGPMTKGVAITVVTIQALIVISMIYLLRTF